MKDLKLFNKSAILIFSILGTTFLGGLLFSTNLKTAGKSKYIASTVIFTIVWIVLCNWLLKSIDFPLVKYFAINLIGGLILIKPLWKYHFADLETFYNRSIWGPLAAACIPITGLIALNWINQNQAEPTTNSQKDIDSLIESASENTTFVSNDSIIEFQNLRFTLPAFSIYYTFENKSLSFLSSTIYYEEGDFSFKCSLLELGKGEPIQLDYFENLVDTISFVEKNQLGNQGVQGYYESYEADTIASRGHFILFNKADKGYIITTDYPVLHPFYGDSLSSLIFNSIKINKTAANIK